MKNLVLIALLLPSFLFAQDKKIIVEGKSPDLYLIHKTGPKENFYSIGRLYNISPRVYAPYNNLSLEGGLAIGQEVKIPLNEVNFSQDGNAGEGEVFVPLYHKAGSGENINQVSSSFNNVRVATLKKWNKMDSETIRSGSNVIIGFLKVNKELSAYAAQAVNPGSASPAPAEELVINTQSPTEPAKETTAVTPATPPMDNSPVVVKEEPVVPVVSEPVKNPALNTGSGNRGFNGGQFKDIFSSQAPGKTLKEELVKAGMFKSTSGWEDGKYYCFHNGALAGTIVKVTNPSNNKSVYARVLDVIPDISQNAGMGLRLSNSAADELGFSSESFDCVVAY